MNPTENPVSIVETCLPNHCIAAVAVRTPQKTSHVIAILPVHWRSDCCLATSYKHFVLLLKRIAVCLSSRCLAMRWHVTLYYINKCWLQFIIDRTGHMRRFIDLGVRKQGNSQPWLSSEVGKHYVQSNKFSTAQIGYEGEMWTELVHDNAQWRVIWIFGFYYWKI
jgi:hypothetical protein